MAMFKSVISSLRSALGRTRDSLVSQLQSILKGRRIDEELLKEIHARLIQADVGVKTAGKLVESLRSSAGKGEISRGEDVLSFLKAELKAMWPDSDRAIRFAPSPPTVILVAGVNGVGKTTSVAKIAKALRDQNTSVLLAACDTFRAGAVRQLEVWSERLGVQIVKGAAGGDPAAVAFDACDAAIARGADVLLIDTAGRLHTQDPLMRQLTKIRDVVAKRIPGAPHEVLLVLDATTGQNAVQQAKEFSNAIDVTGLFLAKLDGTAKGGSVIAIREAVNIPVKLVGLGERPDDVQPFDPDSFIEALFSD